VARKEGALINAIRLEASKCGARLFRNNVGTLQTAEGRYVQYGIGGVGGADIVGWTPVTITPEHVGRTLAIFTAIEAKTGRLKPTHEQESFLQAVERAGGIARVVRESDM